MYERLERAQHCRSPRSGYIYLPALVGISITGMLVAPYGARLSPEAAGRHPEANLRGVAHVLGLRMLWGVLVA